MPEHRVRRQPPPFRRVEVRSIERRTPWLTRVTLGGPELVGFGPVEPAASVRLLLARPGQERPEIPTWTGNEFLDADGARPVLRTLTPLRVDATVGQLDVEVVRHGDAPLSSWADLVGVGAEVALSGPGRGYHPDPDATAFLVAGDESALPAITTLLPVLPPAAEVRVLVEVRDEAARLDLSLPAGAELRWCRAGAEPGDALVEAVRATGVGPDDRVWAAGEAAAVQRIRRHLFDEVGLPRAQAVVRGYWKRGRAEAA